MKKFSLLIIAAIAVAGAGTASAFFHKGLFGGDEEAGATDFVSGNDFDIKTLSVVNAGEAGLAGTEGDGGLGTGIYEWDMILGDPNAPIVMTEYASMTCGHCGNFHKFEFKKILANFVATGEVKVLYRDYPLDGVAARLAMIGRCLPADKYFDYVEHVYQEQDNWINDPEKDYFKIPRAKAEELGMSSEKIDECLADETVSANLQRAYTEAQGLGVSSTPTIFFNNKKYSGNRSLADIRKFLDELSN